LAGYDLAGNLTSRTDATNRVTTFVPDLLGRTTQITNPGGGIELFEYDSVGNLRKYTDATSKATRYDYTLADQVSKVWDPRGKDTTYTYDALGRQKSVLDSTGVASYTAYDAVGRVAVRWDNLGASWVTKYDLAGNLVEEKDPAGVTWLHEYNNRELRFKTRGPLAISPGSYGYAYDKAGRLIERKDPYMEKYTYDVRDNVKTVTDAYAKVTGYDYDGAGRTTKETLPTGRTTTWTYDTAGRLDTIRDGLNNTVDHDYDAADRLSRITLPRGGRYDYGYDPAGLLGSEKNPLGKTTTFGYDAAGRLKSTTYPTGRVVTVGYDDAGRQESTTAGGQTRTYGYDDAGRLTSATGGAGDVSFTYNNRGLLASTTDPAGTTTYDYDLAHRLARRAPAAGAATTYTYSTGTLGWTVSARGPINVDIGFNDAFRIRKTDNVAPSGGGSESRGYDLNGRLTSVVSSLDTYTATYTTDGQVASTKRTQGANIDLTEYTYDGAGRLDLATAKRNGATVSTTDHDWDADGNRTLLAKSGQPAVTSTYDLADRLTSSSDGKTYTHNDDGQLTGDGVFITHTYTPFGELATANTNAGSATYGRDALGRVATRTVSGAVQRFSYDGVDTAIAGERTGTGPATQVIRDPSGGLIGEHTVGGRSLRSYSNLHGDAVRFFDDANVAGTTWSASYDAFGVPTSTAGSAPPVALGFQSMPTEPLSGLVDMSFRSYDPKTGRFTAADNVIGSMAAPISFNRYLYGHADPVTMFDPDGHMPEFLQALGDLIGEIRSIPESVWTGPGWNESWGFADEYKAEAIGVGLGILVGVGCTVLTGGWGAIPCAGLGGFVEGATRYTIEQTVEHKGEFTLEGMVAAGAEDAAWGMAFALLGPLGGGVKPLVKGALGKTTAKHAGSEALDNIATGYRGMLGLSKGGGRHLVDDVMPSPSGRAGGSPEPSRQVDEAADADSIGGKACKTPPGRLGAAVGGNSFAADTPVAMADGSLKPIAAVVVGDEVLATDPETDDTKAETVTATYVNHDTELADVTVVAGDGTQHVIQTTQEHLFWSETDGDWVPTGELAAGDLLRDVDGVDGARVVEVREYTGARDMYDLTVDNLHTYYVVASNTPVLVHNCNGRETGLFENHYPDDVPGRPLTIDPKALQHGGVSNTFGYVVKEDRSLVIGKLTADQGHIDLAAGMPVRAAGQFKVVQGKLKFIDNKSGHYMPGGDSAREAAEQAFNEAGWNANGKYVEKWPGCQGPTSCSATH
jgi:RHS repeat-associated protein